ncbi:hypothetical protein NHL50_18810 [Acidimicrobiia bacterium EGI L10123]|uniref:hypothetical protein n=1 Tax=Salinilacustrithrix flava TaxID=2957203 RepID=UPI003D7C32D8|nr:hypothetical protein [Acidimicrobiia bacterium EGI L10123]
MLDHVFTDAIGALRDALEAAMLERMTAEERFQVDVLLGDTTWETSYGLPGEGNPPRVRADITLDWPTWSQSAFRSWLRNEELDDDPRIEISIVLRLQRLVDLPRPDQVTAVLPVDSPSVGPDQLHRTAPTVETAYTAELEPVSHALELAYEGTYDLDDKALGDGAILDDHFSALGGWIASMLVRLGDLPLAYHDPY